MRRLAEFTRNLAREAGLTYAIQAKACRFESRQRWLDAAQIWRRHSRSSWYQRFVRDGAAVLTTFWEPAKVARFERLARAEPDLIASRLEREALGAIHLLVGALTSDQGWKVDDECFLAHNGRLAAHIGDPVVVTPCGEGHSCAFGMFDMLLCGRENPAAFVERRRALLPVMEQCRLAVPFGMTLWLGTGSDRLPLPAADEMNGRIAT